MIKPPAQDNTGNAKEPTMRERMEMHHVNPTCSSCHSLFEPIGLALENFDGVGAWRLKDEGQPIDPTGVLANGTKIDGVASLRDLLMQNSEQFVRVMTEKLLTYALGRGVEDQDMPLVRSIARGRGRAATIAFRRSCWASSRARRSRTTSRARRSAQQTAAR